MQPPAIESPWFMLVVGVGIGALLTSAWWQRLVAPVRSHCESCTLLADDPDVRKLGCTCIQGKGAP